MTRVYVHELAGCTPAPLGHYLKALGVLRLVAEQADPAARGWWKDERFWLATTLDEERLVAFFLNEYRPSPLVAPWNLGSGFYYEDDPGLAPIESATAIRLGELRDTIASARALTKEYAAAIVATKEADGRAKEKGLSDEDKKAAKVLVDACKKRQAWLKERLLLDVRRSWRGRALQWFDAALTLTGEAEPEYPALLGTGGNDGRLDFTNNYYQHLQRLFDPHAGRPLVGADRALRGSLCGEPAAQLTRAAIGQFLPGYAGGPNMSVGYEGAALVNSWDFVLLLEGALLLCSGVSRRADASGPPQAAAPFAVRSRAAGYASATAADESARGEQWLPLWGGPATLGGVAAIFREGRARLGRTSAAHPVDFARSVARLGVARGIHAFERFGYIERNGQANLATPLGRWYVRSAPRQELLDDIGGWLARLRRAARDENAPAVLRSVARSCDEAVLDICRAGDVAQRWQRLLLALGEVERVLVATPKRTAKARLRPIPRLSPGWVHAAGDGSAEVQLALALASQHASLDPSRVLPVRSHWSPVEERPDRDPLFAVRQDALLLGPDLVCVGLDLEKDCIALIRRRVILSSRRPRHVGAVGRWQYPEGRLPLRAPGSCCASFGDVIRFIDRETNDRLILGLARAFMAIDWSRWRREGRVTDSPPGRIDPDYAILRMAHAPDGVPRGDERLLIGLDPETSRRLASGDLASAATVAIRRLRASGLLPVVRFLAGSRARARRLCASLAFPITTADVGRCADLVTKPYEATGASDSGERPTEGP